MADRGILFSAPMVRALLAGRKTQTRRLIRNPEYYGCPTGDCPHERQVECNEAMQALAGEIVPHAVGDRLWVQETLKAEELEPSGQYGLRYLADDTWRPIANDPNAAIEWLKLFKWLKLFTYGSSEKRGERRGEAVPAIHMPRWASRLWLDLTDVRVQRLQDISEGDAIAEGIEPVDHELGRAWKSYETYPDGSPHPHAAVPNRSPVTSYRELWDSLHTEPGTRWADNPWIYALTFTVQQGNIDG